MMLHHEISGDERAPVLLSGAAAIREARGEVVGPAAHLAAVQQPEVVNRLILEHVR